MSQKRETWNVGDIMIGNAEDSYTIESIIEGGLGIVYIVLNNNALYALKTFKDKFAWDERIVQYFIQEANIWIELRHTNIVRADSVTTIKGKPYIILEYISGSRPTLQHYLLKQNLDIQQVLDFMIQFCEGMNYAYNKIKVIHRDIKPSNILITEKGQVKITDFGLAKILGYVEKETNSPTNFQVTNGVSRGMGTTPYMSPEQFPIDIQKRFVADESIKPITTCSDIYSFGVTFYQTLTRRLPFNSIEEVFAKEPLSSRKINKQIDEEFDRIIMKCLNKKPEDRVQSFGDLKIELERIYRQSTGAAKISNSHIYQPLPSAVDLTSMALAFDNLKQFEKALWYYDAALQLDPDNATTLLDKGKTLSTLNRFAEAMECFNKAKELNPQDPLIYNNIGEIFREQEKYKDALNHYDIALKSDSNFIKALLNKGWVLNKLERKKEAFDCFLKALHIDSKNVEALVNIGDYYFGTNELKLALDYCEQALSINHRDIYALNNKAAILVKMERLEEALKYLDVVLQIDENVFEAWRNKGMALALLGHLEKAIHCYNRALQLSPHDGETLVQKAGCLAQFENLEFLKEAVNCCDKALSINLNLIRASNLRKAILKNFLVIGYKALEQKGPIEALRWFKVLQEIEPTSRGVENLIKLCSSAIPTDKFDESP